MRSSGKVGVTHKGAAGESLGCASVPREPASRAPLDGYRILDLARYQTGAGGVGLLADLGADVIKIEHPLSPDPARTSSRGMQMLESCNRNKRAMTLDLKTNEGRRVLYRLVEDADVVAENFRPGVAARLGIEHELLRTYNPGIILASFNGYGSRGPDAEVGAFDMLGHARSGLMDILSDKSAPTPFRYVGSIAIADQAGAIMFAFSILAALVARAVDGVGQHVETSHLSALMALQSYPIHHFFLTQGQILRPPKRALQPPMANIYEGSDARWLAVTSLREEVWPDFCRALDAPDLVDDARFVDRQRRAENNETLIGLLDGIFRTRTRDEWVERLKALRFNVAPVQTYGDLLDDPQIEANRYVQEIDHPRYGRTMSLTPPVSFSKTQPRYRNSVPDVGEHTDEILRQHGFSPEEIGALRSAGIV